jgi:hypothetical protein
MEDDEEIFTTVCLDILWEDIQDGFRYILNLDRWPSKEEIGEFFNLVGETTTKKSTLYENGVEEFIYDLEDTILRLKNEELPRRIDAWTKGRKKKVMEIMEINE